MIKNFLKFFILLTFFLTCCYCIYKNEKVEVNKIDNNFKVKYIYNKINNEKDDSIGNLIIKKINVNNKLYAIDNPKNNVDQNVTILEGSIEPTNENSIMFIAAHSGSGKIAYFKNLDKLKTNDEVILFYKNKEYKYVVLNTWETNKDGDIEVTKTDMKQLILTTCSPNNSKKQLIINCTLKES